ncbi:hypothetical protein Pelo_958 [Pelomyxa schiedti]|nr:hypothetical protein Pelo_958 [Pelomyxa schiedti]
MDGWGTGSYHEDTAPKVKKANKRRKNRRSSSYLGEEEWFWPKPGTSIPDPKRGACARDRRKYLRHEWSGRDKVLKFLVWSKTQLIRQYEDKVLNLGQNMAFSQWEKRCSCAALSPLAMEPSPLPPAPIERRDPFATCISSCEDEEEIEDVQENNSTVSQTHPSVEEWKQFCEAKNLARERGEEFPPKMQPPGKPANENQEEICHDTDASETQCETPDFDFPHFLNKVRLIEGRIRRLKTKMDHTVTEAGDSEVFHKRGRRRKVFVRQRRFFKQKPRSQNKNDKTQGSGKYLVLRESPGILKIEEIPKEKRYPLWKAKLDFREILESFSCRSSDTDHEEKTPENLPLLVSSVTSCRKRTLLHIACKLNKSEWVTSLLKLGANSNAPDRYGATPLHLASRHNSCDSIEILFNYGVKMDAQNNNGWTALMVAARHNHIAAVEKLLSHSVSPFLKSKTNKTALHIALASGHISVAKIITDAILKLTLSGKYCSGRHWDAFLHKTASLCPSKTTVTRAVGERKGQSTLQLAVKNYRSLSVFVDTVVHEKPSHPAVLSMFSSAINRGDILLVQKAIESGVDVNLPLNSRKWTALHIACKRGFLTIVKLLLAHPEIEPDSKTTAGQTALHIASKNIIGPVETNLPPSPDTKTSKNKNLKHQPNPRYRESKNHSNYKQKHVSTQPHQGTATTNKTPTHDPVMDQQSIIAALLAHPRVEINSTDNHGWNALRISIAEKNSAVEAMLRAAGAVESPVKEFTKRQTVPEELTELEEEPPPEQGSHRGGRGRGNNDTPRRGSFRGFRGMRGGRGERGGPSTMRGAPTRGFASARGRVHRPPPPTTARSSAEPEPDLPAPREPSSVPEETTEQAPKVDWCSPATPEPWDLPPPLPGRPGRGRGRGRGRYTTPNPLRHFDLNASKWPGL